MKNILSDEELDQLVSAAKEIAAAKNYDNHVDTAKNHAALQAGIIKVNTELIKTIRHLDEKNGKLQKLLFWLSVVATVATIVALLK